MPHRTGAEKVWQLRSKTNGRKRSKISETGSANAGNSGRFIFVKSRTVSRSQRSSRSAATVHQILPEYVMPHWRLACSSYLHVPREAQPTSICLGLGAVRRVAHGWLLRNSSTHP